MTNEELDKAIEKDIAHLAEIEKRLKALDEEQLAQTNALIHAHIETPLMMLMVVAWVAGAAMADNWWSFLAALCLPIYAWVIVVVKFLGILGVV